MYETVGEQTLRAAISDFVDSVYADTMIGFFFDNFDKERLKQHEFQFTARALGADIPYSGRPLRTAHAKHPIMGGQFNRRLTLFREALQAHLVPPEIVAHLLRHTEKLRPLVTTQPGSDCLHNVTTGPLLTSWQPDGEAPTETAPKTNQPDP
jgi:hemoglobin